MTAKTSKLRLASAVLSVLLTPLASAQTTLTWDGAAGSGNASAANNWDPDIAPSANTSYHFVFDVSNLTNATKRTAATWNVANVISLP
jgi:hypothetical protein